MSELVSIRFFTSLNNFVCSPLKIVSLTTSQQTIESLITPKNKSGSWVFHWTQTQALFVVVADIIFLESKNMLWGNVRVSVQAQSLESSWSSITFPFTTLALIFIMCIARVDLNWCKTLSIVKWCLGEIILIYSSYSWLEKWFDKTIINIDQFVRYK